MDVRQEAEALGNERFIAHEMLSLDQATGKGTLQWNRSRVSGYKFHSMNWLESEDVKVLKLFSVSSSFRGAVSNGGTLNICKVLCKVPGRFNSL